MKGGSKSNIERHHPRTSRATFDAQERAIERHERQSGKAEAVTGCADHAAEQADHKEVELT